jgi:hypothetical protein
MLQRLAIAIYLLTMTARAIYCACGEGGDPFPLPTAKYLISEINCPEQKVFHG